MANMIINAKTGKQMHNTSRSGLTGFISWTRLEKQLRAANELKPDEEVIDYEITENGIQYRIR